MADHVDQQPGEGSVVEEKDFSDAFMSRSTGEAPQDVDDGKSGADAPGTEDKPDAGQEPASEAAGEPAANPGSALDPWAGMSPEQRAHWERVQHSEQSQRGRVAALTRKQQTQAPARPAPKAESEAPAASNDGKTPEEKKPAASDRSERIRQAAEEYPDAVGALVEEIAELREKIDKTATTVQPIVEEQDAAAMARAYAELERVHPDYVTIGNDPNYAAWVGDQPQTVKQMANSYDSKEVAMALTLFKAERAAASASTEQQDDPAIRATDRKRERQLEGSKVITNRGAPVAAGTPDDFGAAFQARAGKAR